MNTINENNCLILIVDIQEKLVKMLKEDEIVQNSIKLVKAASVLNLKTVVTEQYPKGLGPTINEIKVQMPNAQYIEKTSFSAFAEVKHLLSAKQIILFGIETHICVLQTAFELLNNGYDVFVVENACGSRDEIDKISALKRLRQAGAQIVTLEQVIFELLKSSKHSNFKEIQAIIK